jgi:hypothetical protein
MNPANEYGEEVEKLKAGIIQYAVDLSFGYKNKTGSRKNMKTALDLLLTNHSAYLLTNTALLKGERRRIIEQIREEERARIVGRIVGLKMTERIGERTGRGAKSVRAVITNQALDQAIDIVKVTK